MKFCNTMSDRKKLVTMEYIRTLPQSARQSTAVKPQTTSKTITKSVQDWSEAAVNDKEVNVLSSGTRTAERIKQTATKKIEKAQVEKVLSKGRVQEGFRVVNRKQVEQAERASEEVENNMASEEEQSEFITESTNENMEQVFNSAREPKVSPKAKPTSKNFER